MSTTGKLHLRIARGGDRSIAVDQYHRGALRVFRPLYLDETGQVTYYVVIPEAGTWTATPTSPRSRSFRGPPQC